MIHIETHISPDNIQGLSCLTIIVAIKSTPRAILNMILHISSPDIFIGTIADNSTLQLREFGELKHNYVSNDSVLREMGILALIQRTDYLLPKFATTFGTKISSREQWVAYLFFFRNRTISIFMDGSKTDTGTSIGTFCDDLHISGCPKHAQF